jgi:hypothetical protein
MISAALIGKAGEMLVAAELMRRGVEVAIPCNDVGVDLLAYRLAVAEQVGSKFIPIQIKTSSGEAFSFKRDWLGFRKAEIILIWVWHAATVPQFYIFESVQQIEEALGSKHAGSSSWIDSGVYTVTTPTQAHLSRMAQHLNRWERIIDKLNASAGEQTA